MAPWGALTLNECGCHLKAGELQISAVSPQLKKKKKPTVNILIYFPPEVKQYEISEHQIGDGGPITAEHQFMKNAFLYPPESPRTGKYEHMETRFGSQEDTKEQDRVTDYIRQSHCSFGLLSLSI